MKRPIMTSTAVLREPSLDATPNDAAVARDLQDTLASHAEECVGMAANMIGVNKRIIAFQDDALNRIVVMFNPQIIQQNGEYTTEEGCLSLQGLRATTRFHNITVQYADADFKEKIALYSGWTAQIIQHEIDHCSGILI
ncbi:peptide deformylase [Bifidobacterium tsurumiense]|nr:peptide deformylase [Bifidobacterium tsurumiense]MDY4678282.1 peptide deformylase [Bifidobacterium tsurumiense]MSS12727.1 peptide deformylase [Bifidobacterium tsurumiense]